MSEMGLKNEHVIDMGDGDKKKLIVPVKTVLVIPSPRRLHVLKKKENAVVRDKPVVDSFRLVILLIILMVLLFVITTSILNLICIEYLEQRIDRLQELCKVLAKYVIIIGKEL